MSNRLVSSITIIFINLMNNNSFIIIEKNIFHYVIDTIFFCIIYLYKKIFVICFILKYSKISKYILVTKLFIISTLGIEIETI